MAGAGDFHLLIILQVWALRTPVFTDEVSLSEATPDQFRPSGIPLSAPKYRCADISAHFSYRKAAATAKKYASICVKLPVPAIIQLVSLPYVSRTRSQHAVNT